MKPSPSNRDFRQNNVYSAVGELPPHRWRSTLPERMKLFLQLDKRARTTQGRSSRRWHVPVSQIEAKTACSPRRLGARCVSAKWPPSAASIRLTSEPTPKPPDQWSLLGKASPSKLTNRLVVNGSAIYGIECGFPACCTRRLIAIASAWRQAETQRIRSHQNNARRAWIAIVDPDQPRKPVKSVFGNGENAARVRSQ